MKTIFSLAAAILATTFTVSFATAAIAETPTEVSTRVSFAGLDLNTPAGKKQLDRRIRFAATQVCDSGSTIDLKTRIDMMRCEKDAFANAQSRVAALTSVNVASR